MVGGFFRIRSSYLRRSGWIGNVAAGQMGTPGITLATTSRRKKPHRLGQGCEGEGRLQDRVNWNPHAPRLHARELHR